MWSKFKWDMFITSFIPLWVSIVIFDIWDLVVNSITIFSGSEKIPQKLINCALNNPVQIISVLVITLVTCNSIRGINRFLKERDATDQNAPSSLLKARKANKLSSEFLLAYILPLIAFDFCDIKDIVLFSIYFAILSSLCIRNNNIYTNILLEFKNYRLYVCDIQRTLPGDQVETYYDSLVISKNDLTALEGKVINCWDCDNYTYIHIKGAKDNE